MNGCARPADIIAEARQAVSAGAREVQLLGQIVNHYQAPDDGCDFAGLLERLAEIDGLERLRFASPHPRHVTPRMIDAMRRLPKVCRHLHLPVQSGSSRILAAMRRRYTRDTYLDLIDRVRDAIPDIALSTDMIVGFPGETAADFEATLSLTTRVRFHSMFSFKYSPRPNTLALKRLRDDVEEGEKTRRIVALQGLQREIAGGAVPAGGRLGRSGPGRLPQPAAGLGVVGPHQRQHGGELRGPARLDRAMCRSGLPPRIPTV